MARTRNGATLFQFPAKRNFVPWTDFRLRVDGKRSGPLWYNRGAVTYYSTRQLLLFLECHDMGTRFFGNTENWDCRSGQIPKSWVGGGIQFEPIRSLQSFRKFERVLDAIAWFAEERAKNDHYVLTRSGWQGRRQIDDQEHAEMETRSVELVRRCRARFRVTYPQVIEVIRFLCERWGDWERIGYQNHKKAYQTFIGKSVTLARYLKEVPPQQIFEDVGRVTGHFKPSLWVIFQDWASEWREDAERLIISFSRPDAILKADFTKEQANAFLDFVEGHDLYEFYWRWRSLNERAFSGDSRRLAGLKSDLQGMALSVEHLVHAMLVGNVQFPKTQLYEKLNSSWKASENRRVPKDFAAALSSRS